MQAQARAVPERAAPHRAAIKPTRQAAQGLTALPESTPDPSGAVELLALLARDILAATVETAQPPSTTQAKGGRSTPYG